VSELKERRPRMEKGKQRRLWISKNPKHAILTLFILIIFYLIRVSLFRIHSKKLFF
jgi:hypothetical protein